MWKSLLAGAVFTSIAAFGVSPASAWEDSHYYGHGHQHYGHSYYSDCCYYRSYSYRRVGGYYGGHYGGYYGGHHRSAYYGDGYYGHSHSYYRPTYYAQRVYGYGPRRYYYYGH